MPNESLTIQEKLDRIQVCFVISLSYLLIFSIFF
jgi:hypothetical protein